MKICFLAVPSKFDNVILSPHNAMNEDKAIGAITKNTVDVLIEELDEMS